MQIRIAPQETLSFNSINELRLAAGDVVKAVKELVPSGSNSFSEWVKSTKNENLSQLGCLLEQKLSMWSSKCGLLDRYQARKYMIVTYACNLSRATLGELTNK